MIRADRLIQRAARCVAGRALGRDQDRAESQVPLVEPSGPANSRRRRILVLRVRTGAETLVAAATSSAAAPRHRSRRDSVRRACRELAELREQRPCVDAVGSGADAAGHLDVEASVLTVGHGKGRALAFPEP